MCIINYKYIFEQALLALQNKRLDEAFKAISIIMTQNMSFAEPHNLLGIYYEILGDDDKARRHYRAAYALDPTYKPACHNLERLVTWYWNSIPRDFDYGETLSISET